MDCAGTLRIRYLLKTGAIGWLQRDPPAADPSVLPRGFERSSGSLS